MTGHGPQDVVVNVGEKGVGSRGGMGQVQENVVDFGPSRIWHGAVELCAASGQMGGRWTES